MPGFSRADQQLLALLALGRQGKLGKLESLVRERSQWVAILCLRLAVLLLRRRADIAQMPLPVSGRGDSIVVPVNRDWLTKPPLRDFSPGAARTEWRTDGFSLHHLWVS